jgi:hypothetical protein
MLLSVIGGPGGEGMTASDPSEGPRACVEPPAKSKRPDAPLGVSPARRALRGAEIGRIARPRQLGGMRTLAPLPGQVSNYVPGPRAGLQADFGEYPGFAVRRLDAGRCDCTRKRYANLACRAAGDAND